MAADAAISVEHLTRDVKNETSQFVSQQLTQSTRPELDSAKIIISGGRALKAQKILRY